MKTNYFLKFMRRGVENDYETTPFRVGHKPDSILSRFSLASLICLFMLTLGIGNVWATDDTYDFNTAGITKVSGPGNGDQTSSSTDVVFTSKTGNTTDSWTIEFTGDTYYGYGTNNGVHFGKNAAPPHATLTSKSYSNVTGVSITSTQGNASVTITVSVGGTSFGSLTSGSNTTHSFTHAAATGAVSINVESTTNGRFQINSITITTASNFTVTYDGNGKSSGTVPTDASSPYAPSSTVTVKANTGDLARTGCTFAGWNTAADGSGTDYAASGLATFTITENTTLYAKWTATVTWVVNGVTAQTDNIVVPAAGKSVTPPSAPNPASNCGDKFMGWTTVDIGASGQATDAGLSLFTSAPTVYGSTTYYAVFADYAE